MAVRFEYKWHDHAGQWYRSYGNELWEFDEDGYMQKRFASINDMEIVEANWKLHGYPLRRELILKPNVGHLLPQRRVKYCFFCNELSRVLIFLNKTQQPAQRVIFTNEEITRYGITTTNNF